MTLMLPRIMKTKSAFKSYPGMFGIRRVCLHLHEIVERDIAVIICECVFARLSVCLSICLSVSEQNFSRKYAPIWTRFSPNGCVPHWLGLN